MSADVEIMLRRRIAPDEPIEAVHARVFDRLRAVDPRYWSADARPPAPECGAELSASVDIAPFIPGARRARLEYILRSADYDGDEATYDDFMVIELDGDALTAVRYRDLLLVGFPAYVAAYEPYGAHVQLDVDLALDHLDQDVDTELLAIDARVRASLGVPAPIVRYAATSAAPTGAAPTGDSTDPWTRPEAQPILRGIAALKKGLVPDERCAFCTGTIEFQAWGPPGGSQPNSFRWMCPCGKSNGSLMGV